MMPMVSSAFVASKHGCMNNKDSRSAGNPLATWEREVSSTIAFARHVKEVGKSQRPHGCGAYARFDDRDEVVTRHA